MQRKRKHLSRMISVVLLAGMTLVLASCSSFSYDESLGSAHDLSGNTILVSVFADDRQNQWDWNSEADQQSIANVRTYMGIASEYLEDCAAYYQVKADIIYDFEENEDLCYRAQFDADVTEENSTAGEECMNRFIAENIDTEALRNKYKADNIIYFMIVNTDEECKAVTCTRNWYEGMEYPYEIVFLYNVDSGLVNCPAVYAHEMLHAFGAPDLYYPDEEYGFTQEFLDYVQTEMSNDIMYTNSDPDTGDYDYDRIVNEVSELDAYYAGLTDTSAVVQQFGLKQSQHQ